MLKSPRLNVNANILVFQVPFWSRKVPGVILSISTVLMMVALVLAAVFGVILYRMSMVAALSLVDQVIRLLVVLITCGAVRAA